jgi:hypothetical protein
MSSAGTTIVAPSRSMAGAAREGEAGRRMVVEGAAGSEDRAFFSCMMIKSAIG